MSSESGLQVAHATHTLPFRGRPGGERALRPLPRSLFEDKRSYP
jgi:hypothetical protein